MVLIEIKETPRGPYEENIDVPFRVYGDSEIKKDPRGLYRDWRDPWGSL